MLIGSRQKITFTNPKTYSLILACGWTCVIAISLLASITVHRQEIVTLALSVARVHIEKDILFRNWNAIHGGIYVVADKGVSPNPYLLPTVLEREVITPSGRRLILVNPAMPIRDWKSALNQFSIMFEARMLNF